MYSRWEDNHMRGSEIAASAEKIAVNLHAYLDGIGLHSIVSGKYFDIKEQIDHYMDNLIRSITAASSVK